MKKIVLALVLFYSTISFAQTTQTVYCEMIGSEIFSKKGFKISFDFGEQKYASRASDDNQIVNEEGKIINFPSMVAALNYMAYRGWKLHTAYVAARREEGRVETYRYILTKELDPNESATDGILLMGEYKKWQEKQIEKQRETPKGVDEKIKSTWDDLYK